MSLSINAIPKLLHWTLFSLLLDLLVLVEQFVPSLRTQRNWRQGTSKEHCSNFTDSQIQWVHLEAGFGSARRVRHISSYFQVQQAWVYLWQQRLKKGMTPVSAVFYYFQYSWSSCGQGTQEVSFVFWFQKKMTFCSSRQNFHGAGKGHSTRSSDRNVNIALSWWMSFTRQSETQATQ